MARFFYLYLSVSLSPTRTRKRKHAKTRTHILPKHELSYALQTLIHTYTSIMIQIICLHMLIISFLAFPECCVVPQNLYITTVLVVLEIIDMCANSDVFPHPDSGDI